MAQDSDQPHQKVEQRQRVCLVMFIATGTACSWVHPGSVVNGLCCLQVLCCNHDGH